MAKNVAPGNNNLLVVESPAKAKTIKKFLGRTFTVKASMGHVRDIPSKGRGKKALGIDIDNGFLPTYEPIKGREKVLDELRDAAEKADMIYLAPDPDREGEAIAWHIQEALHLPSDKTCRVTFNAITKSAIQEAIQHPSEINMNLVNAQQGRRVLDRLVGYSLSPFLWKKITKGLSAGRVQSVAVRLVVDREREIEAFKPEEFWRIAALVAKTSGDTTPFVARLTKWNGEKFALGTPDACREETVRAIADALNKSTFTVTSIDEREVKGRPNPPFITSTLQQAASTWLRFSTDRTMRIAQQLYEGVALDGGEMTGLITYMRTDSTRIAPEALSETRQFIENHYDPKYLPEKAQVYSSRKNAQDAHEAIRPTSVLHTPERVQAFLSPEQFRLYDLIWRRFVASQMNPAIYQTTTATIEAAKGILEAKGRRIVFDGHTVLGMEAQKKANKEKDKEKEKEESDESEETLDDKDQILPALAKQEALALQELTPSQHFTQPPPRYSEASLVRMLEKEGIGRPSTYAPIVKTIQDRGYVRLETRRFFATELGCAVTDILVKNFAEIMDLKFTAGMEADLDHVEEGTADWGKVIERFYGPFSDKLDVAVKTAEPLKGQPAPNGEKCPLCSGDMLIRYSRGGAFLGCANYPECKGLTAMPGDQSAGGVGEDGEELELVSCPQCNAPMMKKRSRYGDFLACSGYPACKQTLPLGRDGKPVHLPEIKMDCDKCGKPMAVKMGRRGPFLACSGYPDCKNTKHLDREGKVVELPVIEGEVCDKCGAAMIVRMSRRGPFLACSAFPKCRNAKNIPGTGKDKDKDASSDNADGEGKPTAKKKTAKKSAKKVTKKTAKAKTKRAADDDADADNADEMMDTADE